MRNKIVIYHLRNCQRTAPHRHKIHSHFEPCHCWKLKWRPDIYKKEGTIFPQEFAELCPSLVRWKSFLSINLFKDQVYKCEILFFISIVSLWMNMFNEERDRERDIDFTGQVKHIQLCWKRWASSSWGMKGGIVLYYQFTSGPEEYWQNFMQSLLRW